jgi:hypothetical protein
MRARLVAPLVAAILGITGGVVTALVTDTQDPGSTETQDPLGLGIPLVNLECDPNQGILILGSGDTAPALLAAMAENPDGEPRYLDTRESCDTIYGPERQETPPEYALFLGPYEGLTEPCTKRMDPLRRGDYVTKLQSGNTDTVMCVCVLGPSAGRPELRVGMVATAESAVWIRSLQGMFADADEDQFLRKWVTGEYDQRTADRVAQYQEASRSPSERGVVDDRTWGLLASRLCGDYDF